MDTLGLVWSTPYHWGIWAFLALLGYILMRFCSNLSKAAKLENPEDTPSLHVCHYCGLSIGNDYLMRHCPNCKGQYLSYHHECGTGLNERLPYCNGVYVGDKSGHTIDTKHRNLCAKCGLGKEYWLDYYCAPNSDRPRPRDPKAIKFTPEDVKWLRNYCKATLGEEEPVTRNN